MKAPNTVLGEIALIFAGLMGVRIVDVLIPHRITWVDVGTFAVLWVVFRAADNWLESKEIKP